MVQVLERLWMILFISYKNYFNTSIHNFVLGPKVVTHELQKIASPTNHGMQRGRHYHLLLILIITKKISHGLMSCKFTLWFEGTNDQLSI
jgi:hypothetical protein